MSSINFGGLASGMDTESIISALMEIERQPIKSLESDQSYLETETSAYAELNTKLSALQDAVEDLDTIKDISSYSATSSDETILTATTSSTAFEGSYDIQVMSLAETQKDVSAEGFADASSPTLSGSLTIGDTTINYSAISLGDLKDLINAEDTGLSAAIINDGTDEGFRLMFTASEAGETTEISGSGDIDIDTAANGHTKQASQAHVIIDGIDIYSIDNTVSNAIPGVTLDLSSKTAEGELMTLTVATDTDAITEKLDTFVATYNSITSWVKDQADADWGNDSGIRSVQRKMQSMISTTLENSSTYTSLVGLGFETDYETGMLSYNSTTMTDAISNDIDNVLLAIAGDDQNDSIMDMFANYLTQATDSSSGIYALRKASNESSSARMEDRIYTLEMRLEQRETTMRAQYTAMEQMISAMNSQTSYLSAFGSMSSTSSDSASA
jgi:flagellar hook-associated protein 2